MIASTQTGQPFAGNDKASAPAFLQFIAERLKSGSLRTTRQRRAILAVLGSKSEPMCIDAIHRELGINCDLVTVYRTMAMFEEVGLVRRSFRHNGTTEFELNDKPATCYRVVCKLTNQVVELDDATSTEIRAVVTEAEAKLKALGYTEVGHLIQFFAILPRRAEGRTTPRNAEIRGGGTELRTPNAER